MQKPPCIVYVALGSYSGSYAVHASALPAEPFPQHLTIPLNNNHVFEMFMLSKLYFLGLLYFIETPVGFEKHRSTIVEVRFVPEILLGWSIFNKHVLSFKFENILNYAKYQKDENDTVYIKL